MKQKIKKSDGTYYIFNCSYCNTKIEYKHGFPPEKCINNNCESHKTKLGSKLFDKPKTERVLFELQEEYLKTRNDKILLEMFEIIEKYTASLIKKKCINKFTLSASEISEKAFTAATLLLEQYLHKPEFLIDDSFAGYLNWKIREVLWKYADDEMNESLNKLLSEDSSTSSLLDMQSSFNFKSVFDNNYKNNVFIIEEINKILKDISVTICMHNSHDEYRKSILCLIAFKHFINNDSKKLDILFEVYGSSFIIYFDKIKESLYELYKLYKYV